MPRYHAESYHPDQVAHFFEERGFSHLSVRKHGNAVIVESGSDRPPAKHIRLRRDTVNLWCLDFANHRGKWERTPFRDQLTVLLEQVVDDFPWTVADVS